MVDRLVRGVDLGATGVFALEGGAVGALAHLDVFGVFVLAGVTALGGGILRDLLIGDTPPAAIQAPPYLVTALGGGAVVVVFFQLVQHIPSWLLTGLDAAGLALFCASGAAKALDFELNPLAAVFMGVITAVGGGVLRDMLLAGVPAVLRVHVYAAAALLGATLVVVGIRRGLPRGPVMLVGGAACFLLRVVSAWQGWNLPHVIR